MSSKSVRINLHRSAIALNNIGVSFLRRGNYRNSLHAFTKAFMLMEYMNKVTDGYAFDSSTSKCNNNMMSSLDWNKNEFVIKASKNLARSNVRRQESGDKKRNFQVIELDTDSDFEILHMIVNEIPKPSCRTVIWIEVFVQEAVGDLENERFQFDSAIVLFNLSSACLLYEVEKPCIKDLKQKDAMYEKVLNICTGSYDILSNLYCIDDDCFQARRVGLLMILVLQTLITTSTKLDQHDTALDYSMILGDIRDNINACEAFVPDVSDCMHPIAAAQA